MAERHALRGSRPERELRGVARQLQCRRDRRRARARAGGGHHRPRARRREPAEALGLGRGSRPDRVTHDDRSAGLEAGLRVMLAAGEDGLHAMRADAAVRTGSSPPTAPCARCAACSRALHTSSPASTSAPAMLSKRVRAGARPPRRPIQTLCLAQLALIALDDDDLGHAEATAGRALTQVERFELGDYPTAGCWSSLSPRPSAPLAGASRRRVGTFAGPSACWPGSPTSPPGMRPRSAWPSRAQHSG